MKKRLLYFIMVFVFVTNAVMAQSRTVTGTVTDKLDGGPIPGVSILVKGSSIGAQSNAEGKYSIAVPQGGILVFKFVGYTTREIAVGTSSIVNIALEADSKQLGEVVVTALGISREKKALGYSVQEVKGDDLTKGRDNNIVNALSGKVSGVSVTGSTGSMGGSSRILIRGVNSVSGNNQPLFVVDGVPIDNKDYNSTDAARGAGGYDYGNLAQDINPEDVESVSVLKGPNAAALYGSRAANGVILITTKKGKSNANNGIGVQYTFGVGLEDISIFPHLQREYGGGASDSFEKVNIGGKEFNIADYATDESWGPKLDGTPVLQWGDLARWEIAGKQGLPTASPWVAPANDAESFFKTGVNLSHNISFGGGNEKGTYRLSYANNDITGYVPNSSLKKNSLSFNGTSKLSDKLNVFSVINYTNTAGKNRPETGYGDNNVMQKFVQWGQRNLDMKELEQYYMYPDGTQISWNRSSWDDPTPAYSNNPYWSRYMNGQNDSRNRLYGNFGFSYDIVKWLKFQAKVNADYYNFRQQERNAVYSQEQSAYADNSREYFERNYEFLFMFNKDLSDKISLSGNFGGNRLDRNFNRVLANTQGGLLIPGLYTLYNSAAPATVNNYSERKRVNSLYGSFSLGYNKAFFLDGTLRNDWSSTLPAANNSFLYPSITGSVVLTELEGVNKLSWLSFAKVRGSWSQVGNDTDPYQLIDTYVNSTNFGSDAIYSVNSTIKNSNLKPEIVSSWEVGAEARFLKNRLGFDVTYYSSQSKDQILPVTISGGSGYNFMVINAGLITNKGVELMLTGRPIESKRFTWNSTLNFTRNRNVVMELTDGVDVYQLANGPFNVSVNAKVGESYGVLMGTDFIYDENGNKVVDPSTGLYLSSGVKSLGSVMPKFNLGFNNTFKFDNFDLSVLFDMQKGGKYFSTTNMWGMYSGMLDQTAGLNDLGNPKRDAVANGGGILVNGWVAKTDANGNIIRNADGTVQTEKKSDIRVEAQTWAEHYYNGPAAQNVFKSDYIKLREVRLGYTVPSRFTGPIKGLNLALYGRNLAIFGTDNKNVDPELTTSSGNVQGIDGGALPAVRTFGFNASFKF